MESSLYTKASLHPLAMTAIVLGASALAVAIGKGALSNGSSNGKTNHR